MRELHAEDCVARLEQRHVDGVVRLCAGVRLHVRVLGAEELLRPVDGQLLDLVHHLATAVIAPARIALRVLVRGDAADGLEHTRPGEVLGRDELDLAPLPLELSHGGHLTHGLKVNFSGKLFNIVGYGVDSESYLVDFDEVLRLAKESRPKLIICGGSAYPRTIEADRFREIADEVGALLLCDMAHFAGLVAAGLHPNPTPHCDFVTSTTHKTLAGPRSGFILCKEEHAPAVDKAVFPGMQGGPLLHVIAAKATCFKIAASEPFRAYQAQIRANADALAGALIEGGLDLLTGGTDTHLMQIDLRKSDWTGKAAEERLHEVKITANRNTVPFDERPPMEASGVRLGTPAVTMRGFDEDDLREVGAIISSALSDQADIGTLAARSEALCDRRPLYPGFRGYPAYTTT
jgi:glycine hydroxymethyltransferase